MAYSKTSYIILKPGLWFWVLDRVKAALLLEETLET